MACRTRRCGGRKRRSGRSGKRQAARVDAISRLEPVSAQPSGRAASRAIQFLVPQGNRWVDLSGTFGGGAVFLCMNGPSMADAIPALSAARGIVTFGVNNGPHVFRTNMWASVDDPWRFMSSIWSDPTIMKFAPISSIQKSIRVGGALQRVSSVARNIYGFRVSEHPVPSLDGPGVCWGGGMPNLKCKSVMVAALSISRSLGFKRVYLVGCDFRMSVSGERRTGGYFFDEQRSPAAVSNNSRLFPRLKLFFDALRPMFAMEGISVHNCTPGSYLDSFPHLPLEDAIAREALGESLLSESTYGKYVGGNGPQPAPGKSGAQLGPFDLAGESSVGLPGLAAVKPGPVVEEARRADAVADVGHAGLEADE